MAKAETQTAADQVPALHILLVHDRYRLPGGEDTVFEAERAMLMAHGHRVSVYLRENSEVDGHPMQKLLLPFSSVYSRRTAREIRALLSNSSPEHPIDLVHVHNTMHAVSPSVFTACRKAGVPVVQTLHNFRLFCPNGILMRAGQPCEDCPSHGLFCAVRHKCYRGSAVQSLACAAIYRVHRWLGTYRHVWLITPTPFDRALLDRFNGLCGVFVPQRLFVKPHALHLPLAFDGPDYPAPCPWLSREIRYVAAARLEELKGLPTLLAAWAILGEAAPLLELAGTGPLEAWAKQTVREQHLNVQFLGQLPKEELLRRMSQSHGVIAASLCYESFALTPAEALAVGTPVLASRIGNVGAAVHEGVDGFHFSPGSAEELVQAVKQNELLGAGLDLAAAQRRVRAAYGEQENYRRLMEIYAAMLGRPELIPKRAEPVGTDAEPQPLPMPPKPTTTPSATAPLSTVETPNRTTKTEAMPHGNK